MPFTVEHIPEDVVTNGVLSRYSAYAKDRYYPLSSKWVADHERNARMAIVSRVGGASGPYDGTTETDGFALFWHDHVIGVYANPLPTSCPPSGPEMNWRVHRLQLPDIFQARRDEVLDLIREAFRAVGQFFNGERFAAVNVQFDLPGLED
ncbi:MAG: hypothetical protein HZA63_02885 [Rhodocyclales bacterium]|nr:hypothetical protein [Rhodocyclales bacterium]